MAHLPWYEWQNLRNRLVVFCRAVQGPAPYRVRIEADPATCPTGYCDFARRVIAVNPTLFPDVRPRAAFQLTKALLVHEAGHRRFTTPRPLPPVVHLVANILEDERIERLMAEEFAGVGYLLGLLRAQLYAASPDLEPTDDPGQVLAATLQHRWASALGRPLKGALSTSNRARWERVRPLVEAAWIAADTGAVTAIAHEIVDLLHLRADDVPRWVRECQERLGDLEGSREAGDCAETRAPVGPLGVGEDSGAASERTPFDGEIVPDDHPAGTGIHAIEPKPYRDLEERARPLVRALLEELAIEPVPALPDPSERGGRLALRQLVRDPRHPFLLPAEDLPAPGSLALRVAIDHSTSMNVATAAGRSRMESVAEAALAIHLVCAELGIRHAVAVTPQQVVLADNATGERGKALLAGLVPARTEWEDVATAIATHRRALEAEAAVRKVLLVVHDGYPNDAEAARRLCTDRTTGVETIGILLDPDAATRAAMAGIFAERLIACGASALPRKLGALLRAYAGRR
jgi:hypothetical protein